MRRWYPSTGRIVRTNKFALAFYRMKRGDRHELRSYTKLKYALNACKKYKGDTYAKAAILLQGLVKAHAFASGNRRCAFLVTKEFVIRNKGAFAIDDSAANANPLLGIREDFYTLEDIAQWIKTGEIHAFRRSAFKKRD